MKKLVIGALGLGLIIGAMSINSFANEKIVSNTSQGNADFMVLNKDTNQFENVDNSDYINSNPNYGQSCPHMDFGDYRNIN